MIEDELDRDWVRKNSEGGEIIFARIMRRFEEKLQEHDEILRMKADVQINQPEVDVDRCQHEQCAIPEVVYRCIKCGEFYR